MGYSKKPSNNPVIQQWFDQSIALNPGEKLFIPCEDKKDAGALKFSLYQERALYSKLNPQEAYSIKFTNQFKDGTHWVIVSKRKQPMTKALKVGADSVIQDVEIHPFRNRQVIINMMLEDNRTIKEIQNELTNLTKEELIYIESYQKNA